MMTGSSDIFSEAGEHDLAPNSGRKDSIAYQIVTCVTDSSPHPCVRLQTAACKHAYFGNSTVNL